MSSSLPPTANTEQTRPENRAFYPALDGLRCFAFLLVFGQHYFELPWGSTGVDIFFVLSGFLITGILWDTRETPHRVANFYLRRTLRIFPLYYGVMALLLLCGLAVHWQLSSVWLLWPLYLGNYLTLLPHLQSAPALAQAAYVQPHGVLRGTPLILYLGHFWSLCVEEQFYLVWPAVVFLCSRRALLWICAASLPICLLLRLLGSWYLPAWLVDQDVLSRTTPLRFDGLLLGGLIALLLRGSLQRQVLRWSRLLLFLALLIVAIWMLSTPEGHLWSHPYLYPYWYPTWGHTFTAILSGLFILVSIQEGTWAYRLLNRAAFRWIGRLTYGAYVFHDIPHRLYNHVAYRISPRWEGVTSPAIAFVCTMALAWLSFRFFESRFLNLKERWTRTL